MTRRNRKNNRAAVQNVRIVDSYAGTDGAKVDRQLAHMQNSADHIQVLLSDSFPIDTAPTVVNGRFDWTSIRQFDDFVSMATQFNTYRVRSIRFDVYDVSPNAVQPAYWSTVHDQYTAGDPPTYSIADVIDGMDSQMIPPGTGKIQLTWMAHTTNERAYYDVTPATGTAPDFGGLRYSLVAIGGTAQTKFRVSVKAIVDFRGRR